MVKSKKTTTKVMLSDGGVKEDRQFQAEVNKRVCGKCENGKG